MNTDKHEYNISHKAVLTAEVLHYLAPKPGGVYLDATLGAGSHTRAILRAEPTCQVIALDWDNQTLEAQRLQLESEFPGRVTAIWANFAKLWHITKKHHLPALDGILADFGTSQMQIHERAGFSFARNTPLDMRMSSGHSRATAADIIRESNERELTRIFIRYGEEPAARAIARAIVTEREEKPITTTHQLAHLVEHVIAKKNRGRELSMRTHLATRVFQALRIAVNDELKNIELFLPAALNALKPGGRLACISFHSLEDRMVKTFFNEHTSTLTVLTPKPVTAGPEELRYNPSSRSAKLRAAEKLNVTDHRQER